MKRKKWYQEAVINNKKMPTERQKDTNEIRWKRFIEKFLLHKNGLFIDVGCNAGFYSRKARDMGFKVIGIENDEGYYEHAKFWEQEEPKGIEYLFMDASEYAFPVCNIVLLANVHYWMSYEQLERLINSLKEKALYVLVVGRNWLSPKHKYPCDITSLKMLFKDFDNEGQIIGRKHYSVLFKNKQLVEENVDELFSKQQFVRSRKFLIAMNTLIEGNSLLYKKYLAWRGFSPSELNKKKALIKSIQKEGIKTPLLLGRPEGGKYYSERLADGEHRLIIAKKLGIKKVICKQWIKQ